MWGKIKARWSQEDEGGGSGPHRRIWLKSPHIGESRISNNSSSNSNIIVVRLAHGETLFPLWERERQMLNIFSTWPHIVQASLRLSKKMILNFWVSCFHPPKSWDYRCGPHAPGGTQGFLCFRQGFYQLSPLLAFWPIFFFLVLLQPVQSFIKSVIQYSS